jgi:DNA-binding transcriptional MerR regulator
MEKSLPSIPPKRYFTIGEVSELCGVKPHVLRYWEQEFTQLRPMKRRGNRRYYQHHEVLMIRRIRELLYDQGFTISGARNKLQELGASARGRRLGEVAAEGVDVIAIDDADDTDATEVAEGVDETSASQHGAVVAHGIDHAALADAPHAAPIVIASDDAAHRLAQLRRELFEIRELLSSP